MLPAPIYVPGTFMHIPLIQLLFIVNGHKRASTAKYDLLGQVLYLSQLMNLRRKGEPFGKP